MFELVAGLIAFCVAMSFINGVLGFIFYVIGIFIGTAMPLHGVSNMDVFRSEARKTNGVVGGCIGVFVAWIISIYPSYLFAAECVYRLSQ
jgi:hypothetical protein